MCGGRGTRLDADREKPLVCVGDVPMLDRVCDALADSDVETVYAAVSPQAPATRDHARAREDCTVVETPGAGYVADLDAARAAAGVDGPVLTCVADLPLLAPALVDDAIAAAGAVDGGSVTVVVPAALKAALGVSADAAFERDGRRLAPTGLNVVGAGGEATRVRWEARLAVNVNRPADRAVAERLADA
ncbi:MAG: NTP transferase domain-containing protein [Haloarculaceae archaeon]